MNSWGGSQIVYQVDAEHCNILPLPCLLFVGVDGALNEALVAVEYNIDEMRLYANLGFGRECCNHIADIVNLCCPLDILNDEEATMKQTTMAEYLPKNARVKLLECSLIVGFRQLLGI